MKNSQVKKSPYIQLIYRPFWVTVGGLLLILTIALTVLINSSWRAVHRTEPLKLHMAMIAEIQHYNLVLNNLNLENIAASTNESRQQSKQAVGNLYKEMMSMLNTTMILSDEARESLLVVTMMLKYFQSSGEIDLLLANKNIQLSLHSEVNIQDKLLHLLARDNLLELKTTTFIAITLPVLGLLMLFFLRHRILRPLDNLSLLITRLGRREDNKALPTVSLDDIDPILKPLFIDFNLLIQRLSDLEKAQLKYQADLENRVRDATQSLMEYQYTLAQSERLAAIGELTAGLAHELRNPLAGIHLTLENLRSEIYEDDQASRLTLVIEELDRVIMLLNQILDQSHHTPESAIEFNLDNMLVSLIQLVRYQIPVDIKIEKIIEKDMVCMLPQSRLKQAILNLVLNSAQSIGENEGVIRIEAFHEFNAVIIRVSDTGKGFSENMIKLGIRPFMTGRDNGTGLGLSIVRRFCHDLGGEIILKNLSAGGACVELRLPEYLSYES